MSTDYPTALDSFPSIGPNTKEDATGAEHDVVHSNVHDAIAALQTKLGIDASTDATSIDKRLAVAETAVDLNASDIDDINTALAAAYFVPAGGTGAQILAKASDTDGDTEWVDAPSGGGSGSSPTTTKGDLIVRGTSADGRLPVGTDGQIPYADSSETLGIRWGDAPSGSGITEEASQVTILPGSIDLPTDKVTLLKVEIGGNKYILPAWAFDPDDPYFSDVVALTFFDGSGGSSSVIDVIGSTWHSNESGVINTADNPLPGLNSFKLPYQSILYTQIPAIGDQDFTIEGMFYFPSPSSRDNWFRAILLNDGFGSQGQLQLSNFSSEYPPRFRIMINNNATQVSGQGPAVPVNAWHHIELSRSGNTYRLYVDGTLWQSGTSSAAHNFTDRILGFGGHYDTSGTGTPVESAEMSLGMIRVTIGVARHTSNFSPPYARFQTS